MQGGLDYYTGTVYETTLLDHPEIGSVCSGGRYDNLAEYYTDRQLPGRRHFNRSDAAFLRAVRAEYAKRNLEHRPCRRAGSANDRRSDPAIELATELRQTGIRTQLYTEAKKFKAKIQYADKLSIPYVIFLGEDEIAAGTLSVKDLKAGEQVSVSRENAINIILDGIARSHQGTIFEVTIIQYTTILIRKKDTIMMQSRTHTCGELRLSDAGKTVTLCGWMENVRVVGSNFAFVVLRDFYGTTQIVVETEDMMNIVKSINKESTISVTGTVRERASKIPKQATGDVEVVPEKIDILGKCIHNELPFEINRSRDADETQRLKYRYLDLRNPAVKQNIILRCPGHRRAAQGNDGA